MDRIAKGLAFVLGAAGLAWVLGAQGARIGSFEVPALAPGWIGALAALVILTAPRSETPKEKRLGLPGAILLLSCVSLFAWRGQTLHSRTSLDVLVDGERHVEAPTLQIERRNELRRLTGRRRNVAIETGGVLEVPRSGTYVFDLYCDDSCEMGLGSHVLRAEGALTAALELEKGDVPLSLRYRQNAGPARLRLEWDTPSAVELLPLDYYVRRPESAARSRLGAHLVLACFALWWIVFPMYVVRLGGARTRWIASAAVTRGLAALLILYGTALRFEALLAHSGLTERSERAEALHAALLPWLPGYGVFNPEAAPPDPYRADVRSYLDRAGAMTAGTFYAPSFREPFYILLTRGFVSLAGGEIGILLQSFVFSSLTLVLFWLLATRLHGPWWGVFLLVPVSLHEWLVLEAPTGYRMSAYGFFLLAFAGVVALSGARPLAGAAAGALGGLVCLVRLSALSVVIPFLALRVFLLPRATRRSYVIAFAAVLALGIGPFLASNYRAHGDPFYSVSFHTEFWLRAEGLGDTRGPVSWIRYFTDFGRVGEVVRGTALGLTVLPLGTFWRGSSAMPFVGAVTLGLGVIGLFALVRETNRYLAAAYFGHLVPFAYVQMFPSGEMPRFVMPAFFFLVLAAPAAGSSVLTLLRGPANLTNVKRALSFLTCLSIAVSTAGDERFDRLPQKYKDWLEKEVVYIIADKEREAFLDLEAEEEWGAFIEAFWRRRDPDPVTPINEFREEHYRRIEHADRYLGRESAVPGWMTDRGKMYIILGEPRDREEFTSVPFLYPAELWFYDQNRDKGLPPLYLLFFQEYHAGPYRLFNHLLDGPEDLMPAQPLDPNDSRRMAYEILQEINPALAHSTITMRADQGAAAGILQPDRSSLDFQGLISDIYASPFRRVDTRYVDEARGAKGIVETEYLFNYIPSWGMTNVLPGPAGTRFVHYVVEIEPRHMTLARDPDKNVYYTSFELKAEVMTRDESTVVASFSKEPFVQLGEAQFRDVGRRPFAYRDMFPLTSGEFRFRLVLKNRARSEYTIFESELVVPERSGDEPFLGEPVLLYGMSRLAEAGPAEDSAYRTYRIGRVALEPNTKRTVAIGDYLMALVPLENVADDYELRLKVLSQEDEGGTSVLDEAHRLDFYERPVVLRVPLQGVVGGRYRLVVELHDAEGRALASRTAEFNVSPLTELARPWALRDSFEGERVGLVKAALAEQEIRLGRKDAARRLAEEALASDPNAIAARILLARFHLDEGGYREAIRLLEPARAQAPTDVDILLALGDAHLQSSSFARAAELFESAAGLRRPDTALLNALGICHSRLGNNDQAASYLRRSLELDPSQENVRTLLEQLPTR